MTITPQRIAEIRERQKGFGCLLRPAVLERLLSNFTIDPETDCWEYHGARKRSGYGVIGTSNRKLTRTHRIAYEFFIGPITDDKPHVLHHCDNPPCFNPDHLFTGTPKDNTKDMLSKGRAATGERNGMYTHPENRFLTRPPHVYGEANGKAKLTATQVSDIRTRLANGESCRGLGRMFGVHHTTISLIKRERNWRLS
jgi:hypothetical protein